MYLVQAVQALLSALRVESECHNKADILCEFAERLSMEILRRAGFSKPESSDNSGNYFAYIGRDLLPEDVPDRHDAGNCLQLFDVRPTLDQRDGDVVNITHTLVMYQSRVVEWDWQKKQIATVMSYEEAARFVILWFAGKILEIMRENRWERIEQLPGLFDRLADFFSSQES